MVNNITKTQEALLRKGRALAVFGVDFDVKNVDLRGFDAIVAGRIFKMILKIYGAHLLTLIHSSSQEVLGMQIFS